MSAAPGKPGTTIADVGEFGLIDIIRKVVPAGNPDLVLGIGDDAAAFRPTPGFLSLATCDIQVEGRHFLRSRIAPRQLGRRSAAINLSDIGAMGGQPRYALVSLALPAATELAWVRELYIGLCQEMGKFGSGVIGGNLSGSAGQVVIDITLLGEVREEHLVRRRGAQPGDVVLATGTFGASAAGLLALDQGLDRGRAEVEAVISTHLMPTPRVREGMAIGSARLATAMIDVSDGLAADLGHICEASSVGARLFAQGIPLGPETAAIARELGIDSMSLALHGGEDYELVFTCPRGAAAALASVVEGATGTRVSELGEITETPGLVLVQAGGEETALEPLGWDHFARTEKGEGQHDQRA